MIGYLIEINGNEVDKIGVKCIKCKEVRGKK